jgi:hypothetical protein
LARCWPGWVPILRRYVANHGHGGGEADFGLLRVVWGCLVRRCVRAGNVRVCGRGGRFGGRAVVRCSPVDGSVCCRGGRTGCRGVCVCSLQLLWRLLWRLEWLCYLLQMVRLQVDVWRQPYVKSGGFKPVGLVSGGFGPVCSVEVSGFLSFFSLVAMAMRT